METDDKMRRRTHPDDLVEGNDYVVHYLDSLCSERVTEGTFIYMRRGGGGLRLRFVDDMGKCRTVLVKHFLFATLREEDPA